MPTEIEYLQRQISEVEGNLRLIEERKAEFVDFTAIPLDLVKNEKRLQDQLEELRQRFKKLSNAATPEQSASGLSPEAKITKVYVDRDEEKKLFRDMIYGKTEIHILLIEAESGMGKTILLDQFEEISEGFKRARVNFKDASYSLGQILGNMRDQYERQAFPTFHKECRSLLTQFGSDTEHPALICSKIDVQLNTMSVEDRRDYQQVITDAFLADLETIHETIQQPIVMLFDVFDAASVPTQTWIAEQLVMQIRRYHWLVCVITGRQVPRIATDGSNWCLQHKLQPLSDKHSREYILQVKYTQNEELVTLITRHAKGRPAVLQQLVLTYLGIEE